MMSFLGRLGHYEAGYCSGALFARPILGQVGQNRGNPDERRDLDHYEDLELLMNLARAHARKLLLHEPSGQ